MLLGLNAFIICAAVIVLYLPRSIAFTFHNTPSYAPRNDVVLCRHRLRPCGAFIIVVGDNAELPPEEDDDEEEEKETAMDPYREIAAEEFGNNSSSTTASSDSKSSMIMSAQGGIADAGALTTTQDWGAALGKLRERVEDIESGKSQNPSFALFRLMSAQSPNQAIGNFVATANPQVVQAMSGAVSSLLGGLSSPAMGVETIVKASGEKIGSLCFQLQMTGYMFRNAEYVMALKNLMKLRGTATLQDYKDAFNRLDSDKSGYIESSEIEKLLDDVYKGKTPSFEIDAFLKFFDTNKDGKISWDEFERGLGVALARQAESNSASTLNLLPGSTNEDDDDEEAPEVEAQVSGTIEIEMEDGKLIEVDAKEYIQRLKDEAQALKEALRKENMGIIASNSAKEYVPNNPNAPQFDEFGGIASYIASRQGDVKALTEGISPDIVNAMKMLVDFVLEGGSAKAKKVPKEEMSMEIPGSALQQLALWQLILGYRLREAEAKGDYLRLLE